MKRKKYIYLVILITLIISISFLWKSKNDIESGLYGQTSEVINAKNIFPYTEKIEPKIAVIDTGVKIDNSYLKNSNISQDYLDELSQTSKQMHGTMVLGILASDGNGETEPGGLIPKSNILSIQSGTDMGMTTNQLIKSINIAVQKKAKIINISLGTTKNSKELQSTVSNALKKGIIIIASAGNESISQDYYPAAYKGVISVGSINNKKEITEEVNPSNIDIFAPGEQLITSTSTKDEKTYFSGNSAATPIVTSTVAILVNENKNLTSEDIKKILNSSSDTVTYKQHKIKVLNVKQALKQASNI
ncbi:S8 family peptidase [Peribacillus frigoritolerans]|uniref:S8 family peptidase n=1 Tax=Peribacillus frigoritolerans TaxID=450367 RepID=UPI00380AA59E